MAKYYMYNGNPVYFKYSSGKKHEKFLVDNEHLLGCEVSKAEYEEATALAADRERVFRLDLRLCINALMSQANSDRLAGKDMNKNMDEAIAHWLSL